MNARKRNTKTNSVRIFQMQLKYVIHPLHLAIVDTNISFYFQIYERQNATLMSDNDDKNKFWK